MEEPILELKNISISFGNERILNNISMSFPYGKLIAITGPSGCGKSTLIKIAAGIIQPDSGSALIEGKDIFSLPRNAFFQSRREFSFVFQDAALISNLNVYNNVALPLRYHYNLSEDLIDEKVSEILKSFNLEDERFLLPAQLSMGQRKLVGFARGLILEPKLIFFDEPVSGLDVISLGIMTEKLLPLIENPDITIIMVSHNLDFIKSSADYIALIYNNKVFAYGKRDDILKSSDPILQRVLSIIVDEEANVAEEVLGILTGR